MADVSQINLPNGTTYDIVAKKVYMEGCASIGTSYVPLIATLSRSGDNNKDVIIPDNSPEVDLDTGTTKIKNKIIIDKDNNSIEFPQKYSTSEKIIGYWYDNRPIYEKIVIFNSEVSISAGGSNGQGTWSTLQSGWNDEIALLDLHVIHSDNGGDTCWDHLSYHWYKDGKSIRVLNIRQMGIKALGFIAKYVYGGYFVS